MVPEEVLEEAPLTFVPEVAREYKEGKTSTRKTIKDLIKESGMAAEDQNSEQVKTSPKKDLVEKE